MPMYPAPVVRSSVTWGNVSYPLHVVGGENTMDGERAVPVDRMHWARWYAIAVLFSLTGVLALASLQASLHAVYGLGALYLAGDWCYGGVAIRLLFVQCRRRSWLK